jgi:ribose transport system permease protein
MVDQREQTVVEKGSNFLKKWGLSVIRSNSFRIFIVMVIMCVAMWLVSPPFRTANNLLSVAKNFSTYAIAGIGVTLVIITGGIDLSIGSIFGLTGVIATMAFVKFNIPAVPAVLIGLIAGGLLGLINGVFIVKFNLPPFIATLGMLSIARSIAYIITKGYPVVGLSKGILFLGQGEILKIPTPIWLMVVIAIIFSIFLNKTITGRRIYALGGNEEATKISGINTDRLKLLVYSVGGVLYAFSGIITASKLGVGQPTAGNG